MKIICGLTAITARLTTISNFTSAFSFLVCDSMFKQKFSVVDAIVRIAPELVGKENALAKQNNDQSADGAGNPSDNHNNNKPNM